MIVQEQLTIHGRQYTRTWSDAGRYVIRDGVAYVEAIDPTDLDRAYAEGERMEEA